MAANRVSTQELRSAADEIEQMTADYGKQVQSLFQTGTELCQMWDGDANGAFKSHLSQDQPRFESLSRILSRYVQVLRESADAYDKSEAEAVSAITGKSVRRS